MAHTNTHMLAYPWLPAELICLDCDLSHKGRSWLQGAGSSLITWNTVCDHKTTERRDVTGQQGGVRHWVSSTQPEASVEQRSTSGKTVRGRMKGMWFPSRSWMCQNGLKWFGGRELQMVLKELQHHIISFSIKHGLWNQPCAAVRSSKELLPVLVCRSMWLFTARLQAAEGLLNMWTDFGVTQCFKITNGSLLSESGELSVVVPQTGKC